MDERFTENVREALQLAEQESQRLEAGFVGTEHLLLGISKVSGCIAVEVLTALNVDTGKLRLATENLVHRDLSTILTTLGIDVSKFGPELEKAVKRNRERAARDEVAQTPRARNVIDYAKEEAQILGDNNIGTEHILVGLLREQECVAAQLLMNYGLNLDAVRDKIRAVLAQHEHERTKRP